MQKAIDPVGEAKSDFDILIELGQRLGVREAFSEGRDEMGWLEHLYDRARQGAAERGVDMPKLEALSGAPGVLKIASPITHRHAGAYCGPIRKPTRLKRRRAKSRSFQRRSQILWLWQIVLATRYGWIQSSGSAAHWLRPTRCISFMQPKTRLHSQLDGGRVSQADEGARLDRYA